jgi:hypothetical protein
MKSALLKVAISLVYLVPFSPAGFCQSTCVDEERQAAAVRALRAQLHFDFPLQASPVPSLTDNIISLETKGRPPEAEAHLVSFYKMVPASYQLEGNKVVAETIELDNDREWLAAVSHGDDSIYLLEGSNDPVTEFKRLTKDLHLQVADESAALGVFDFFLKVTRGEEFRSHVVTDEMKLESVALEDFRLRFATAKRRAAFSSWWASVPETMKKTLRPPRASPVQDGFDVQYFFYSMGKVWSQNLFVRRDGTVVEGKPNVIFSGNSGSTSQPG